MTNNEENQDQVNPKILAESLYDFVVKDSQKDRDSQYMRQIFNKFYRQNKLKLKLLGGINVICAAYFGSCLIIQHFSFFNMVFLLINCSFLYFNEFNIHKMKQNQTPEHIDEKINDITTTVKQYYNQKEFQKIILFVELNVSKKLVEQLKKEIEQTTD